MGLDMYLYGATQKIEVEPLKIKITLEEVAYWRKQNAIHNWFVKNVQYDVDKCALYSVSKKHLKKLLVECKKVLENPTFENAMRFLPTVDGFFFGGTDLSQDYEMEYYLDGLKYTVKTIRELLKDEKFEYYYYQSSWWLKMVKAELIENPTIQNEPALMNAENVPDVDTALEQWDVYQKLCKDLLDESDYQEIELREKDENGNYVKVKRHFRKKSAWQKLARAFNVDTTIVGRDLERTKMGRVREAYYCVRATLPNGRSVESDALCSRSERGKDKVSDHTIMTTAKTRATNRAIAELIGAGEVSSEEMTAEHKIVEGQSKFIKEGEDTHP